MGSEGIFGRTAARKVAAARFYRDSVDVYRPVQTQGVAGNPKSTFPGTPTHTGVKGNLSDMDRPELIQMFGKETSKNGSWFLCDYSEDIKERDKLISDDGQTYKVVAVDKTTNKDVMLIVTLEKLV